jgi:hypothetical protein
LSRSDACRTSARTLSAIALPSMIVAAMVRMRDT